MRCGEEEDGSGLMSTRTTPLPQAKGIPQNHLWYPVEGHPEIRIAPDVYVVFGRPKGHRGSYQQWEEDNVPLTVVFEVLSPGNTYPEMDVKHAFYEEHGVEEYYVYDPESNPLSVFVRRGKTSAGFDPPTASSAPVWASASTCPGRKWWFSGLMGNGSCPSRKSGPPRNGRKNAHDVWRS